MTNIKNKIFICVFLGLLVLPWVLGGGLRLISPSTYDKLSRVETENRQMAQIDVPGLLDTGASVSNFVDDRIPFRYTLISWYTGLNQAIEGKYQIIETAIGSRLYKPEAHPVIDQAVTNKPIVPGEEVSEAVPADDNYFPLDVYRDVILGREGWLFLYGENEFEGYQGTNILSQDEMAEYLNVLKKLKAVCDAKGKELYFYVAPNKSVVYSQYMPTVEVVNEWRRLQQMYNYVQNNSDVNFIYPLGDEFIASQRYQVYYKYDSHWNHLGGLFGVNALYDAMGVEHLDPMNYIVGEQDAEKYELYYYMGIPEDMVVHNDTEMTVDYKPEIPVNGLDVEKMVCRTTSGGQIDKKLCLIGDSFRVNMMPYLAKDFTKCTFAHRDYMNQIHSDVKDADVIVVEAVERYDYEGYKCAQRVLNILSE